MNYLLIPFLIMSINATFWSGKNNSNLQSIEQLQLISDNIENLRDQNTHLKALTLSILDLLIDSVDNDVNKETERTRVLSIARSISKKHRREASKLPWPQNSATIEEDRSER